MPELLVGYNGGNLRPHHPQDQSGTWDEFFDSQTLVKNGLNRLTIKTSGISETGLMVLHDAIVDREIVTLSDLNANELSEYLKFVGETAGHVKGQFKENPFLTVIHCNQSDRNTYTIPSDLGKPRTNLGYNSQSVGALHIHVDGFERDSFKKINSWTEYRSNFKQRLITLIQQSTGRDFLTEAELADVNKRTKESVWGKRKQANFRIYDRIANHTWSNRQSFYLNNFSELFSPYKGNHLPHIRLTLNQGWESLRNPRLAEAILCLHRDILGEWSNHYQRYLENSQGLPNNLIHPKFNYTWGIAGWRDGDIYLFAKPNPDINGGIESIGIHSIRENRELTIDEIRRRQEFSVQVVRSFLASNNSNLQIGLEGEYLLKAYR